MAFGMIPAESVSESLGVNDKRLIKLNEHLAALLDGLLLLHQPAHPRARVVGDDGWDGPQPRMMTYGRSSPVVALETVLTKVDEGVACFHPLLLLDEPIEAWLGGCVRACRDETRS